MDAIAAVDIEEARTFEHHYVSASGPAKGVTGRIIGPVCLDFGQLYLGGFASDELERCHPSSMGAARSAVWSRKAGAVTVP